jgi:DNA repair exonuclease
MIGSVKKMKFIHIADVHLGATPDFNMPWGAERKKEIWSSFQNILTVCNNEQIDLLLIAGDLFHRQPLVRELKEVNYAFSKLSTTQVVLMAGNHDFISERSNYLGFEWNENVHMFMEDKLGTFHLEELGVKIYGLSYRTREITEALYDTVRPQDDTAINIFLGHGGEEKDIPFNRKKLLDSGFDYFALGHFHKPEQISDKMAYCGSLEPLDKNETGERGYIQGEIVRDGKEKKTIIRFVPNSIREYKRCILAADCNTTNGSLQDQARDIMQANGTEHIYSFCIQGIRDEVMHFDKEAIKNLGNVLEIEDQSVPDYNFDLLYQENSDNMIGMFIKKIRENVKQDELARKALYYGMEALLDAKN